MSNIGFATLSVIPSFQGFQSRLSAGVASPMATAGKNGGKKFGDAAGREAGESFRGRFSGALKNFTPLAGLALGAGAVSLFKGAIDEASALSESGNKINVIFGDAGEQINAFAKEAADNIGQSELAARNAAASMGVFGKAAGLTGDELAGFSTELTSLASDLASFYDTSVDQAAQALSSGLRGEAEPLRQYGVLLDDATLKAEAMRQGLIKTTANALTPQQKILSAHAVILEQTADAQGDFARTSDGLANSQRQLTAEWADMKAALGEELLPVALSFVTFAKDDMLPALSGMGSLAKGAVEGFMGLPAPIKTAAGAMAALALATKFGVGPQNAVDSLRTSMQRLRDEARLQQALANGITGGYQRLGDEAVVASGQLTRLQTASALTRRSFSLLRGAGSSLLGVFGGPWGAALIGGTALVTAFWKQQEEAKQRVESLTATLDEQTGALTENSDEWAARALQDSGALEAARNMGLSLETVTRAALDDADAMQRVNDAIREYALENGSIDQTTNAVRGGIYEVRDAVRAGTTEWQLIADATGKAADASNVAAGAFRNSAGEMETVSERADRYADSLKDARDRLQDLIDKEQERADNAVKRRRDQLGLIQALQETRTELNEGRKTLDINTEAGQANREALYDLADQWNSSSDAVRNKKGAWKDMRTEFIELATAMGGGSDSAAAQARKLAEMLKKPKVQLDTKPIDRATEKVRELEAILARLSQGYKINLGVPLTAGAPTARLNGGPVSAGTPYLVGERRPEVFVPDRPGRIEPDASQFAGSGVSVHIGTVQAHDYDDFMGQVRNRARRAASDGIRR